MRIYLVNILVCPIWSLLVSLTLFSPQRIFIYKGILDVLWEQRLIVNDGTCWWRHMDVYHVCGTVDVYWHCGRVPVLVMDVSFILIFFDSRDGCVVFIYIIYFLLFLYLFLYFYILFLLLKIKIKNFFSLFPNMEIHTILK